VQAFASNQNKFVKGMYFYTPLAVYGSPDNGETYWSFAAESHIPSAPNVVVTIRKSLCCLWPAAAQSSLVKALEDWLLIRNGFQKRVERCNRTDGPSATISAVIQSEWAKLFTSL
jgi:hypothetical protein